MKVYTGIGSRETPEEILEFMKEIASKLGIPIYNLKNEDSYNRLKKLI
jgi:hypothetical protein